MVVIPPIFWNFQVEVVSEDDPPKVLDVMKTGSIFGEVSLIVSLPRRVSVRARTHVDIFTLSKPDLDEVLSHYPVFHAKLNAMARDRFGAILDTLKANQLGKSNTLIT